MTNNTVLVIGEPATGKSASIRKLNPEETFVIKVINKPLPFRSYGGYIDTSESKDKINCITSDNYEIIKAAIKKISSEKKHIKNLIIDDFQYIMANEFIRRGLERGYDKFTEIGIHIWEILNELSSCREDLDCFVLSHSTTDENGKSKCKTIGKLLDEKLTLEGRFIVILHTAVSDGNFFFLTTNDGKHTARTPIDMFEEKVIPNDLQLVKEKMNEYFNIDVPQ